MKLGTRKLEGEGSSSQITKKTQKQQKQPPILVFFQKHHLDSDGVQAVSNLLQLRVAFTNLLTPEKKEILELQRKTAKIKNQKANA